MDMLRLSRFCFGMLTHFAAPLCSLPENSGYEELVISREAYLTCVRINEFSYAANVSYASLNIMFLTACKFCKFLASIAALY
jgi:hypothetical protein